MRYNIVLCGLATLILSVLLSVVPSFASVEVGVDVPPNPSDKYYDVRCEHVYGSTIEYNGRYFGSYVALSYEPFCYGTFIAKSTQNGSSYLMRSYAFIDVTNISDYLWQLYVYSVYQSDSMSNIGWGDVRNSSYQYKNFLTVDNRTYLVVYSNPSLPDNFDVTNITNFYNDNVEYLSDEYWISLTDRQLFDKCLNFDHPQLIGEYDSSIPCLIRADVSFSNVTLAESDVPLVQSGHVVGLVAPITNKGVLSSDYVVDYQVFFGYLTCKQAFSMGMPKEVSREYYSFWKYNGGLDLSIFNAPVEAWTREKYLPFPSAMVRTSCNTISINARLRRKSDGNYGDWYSIGINNLGFNPDSYQINYDGEYIPKSQGYSGIVSGSVQTLLPTADFDDSLTSANAPSTSITSNGTSLGTSESGGVLQQGGIVDLITSTGQTNYDNILDALGDVPQLFGVVFGFFPPYVLAFIGTAFILLVSIGIIKILI